MGRLQLLAIECNYKKLDRQLKEQFIYGLNDIEMLGAVSKELTKIYENDKNHHQKCVVLGKKG